VGRTPPRRETPQVKSKTGDRTSEVRQKRGRQKKWLLLDEGHGEKDQRKKGGLQNGKTMIVQASYLPIEVKHPVAREPCSKEGRGKTAMISKPDSPSRAAI